MNNNTAQNRWLRDNVMDGHGNYLFCLECIVASLGVHTERLHKQRVIKQKQEQQPILQMTKHEVRTTFFMTTTVHTHSQPGGRNLMVMKLWKFSSHMSGMDLLGGDPECVYIV